MNAEQRALFTQMQATMCIVEGYSNHVMNAVGRELLPNYAMISHRFAQPCSSAPRRTGFSPS